MLEMQRQRPVLVVFQLVSWTHGELVQRIGIEPEAVITDVHRDRPEGQGVDRQQLRLMFQG